MEGNTALNLYFRKIECSRKLSIQSLKLIWVNQLALDSDVYVVQGGVYLRVHNQNRPIKFAAIFADKVLRKFKIFLVDSMLNMKILCLSKTLSSTEV